MPETVQPTSTPVSPNPGAPAAPPAAAPKRVAHVAFKAEAPTPPAGPPIKVRATAMGYYDTARRRIGDVFTLSDPVDFAPSWMAHAAATTPERITTGQQELRQHHDEEIAARRGDAPATGRGNPLGHASEAE
jgi:hypothetical protein